MKPENKTGSQQQAITPEQLQQIQELAATLRYGAITLTFQDGILVQIDKNEKIRIPSLNRKTL